MDAREAQQTAAPFEDTPWSIVLRARAGSADQKQALEKLCRAYWPPVYGFIRRRGFGREEAADLAQGFFIELLTADFFERTEPGRGRFRGYLAGALRWFLSDHRERLAAWKRGGRHAFVPLDELRGAEQGFEAASPEADPATEFERQWARTVLQRALARLEAEHRAPGKDRQFAALAPFLTDRPGRGDYERIAAELGTTRTHVAVLVHRLHQRLGELVQREVAGTVADPAEVKEELQHVLRVLAG